MNRRLKQLAMTVLLSLVVYSINFIIEKYDLSPLEPGEYVVTNVIDGDTIEVIMDGRTEKVRFIGVNTPETGGHNTDIECYGYEATFFTRGALLYQTVKLKADSRSSNRDIYDRLLRYVIRARDGYDMNLELIRNGYSKAYTVFPFDRRDEFTQAAKTASDQNLGLWRACPS